MNLETRIRRTTERGWAQLVESKADERLAQLYAAHARPAAKLALLLIGDEQAAQDITQEAFVRIGARFKRLRDPDNAAGYLYRTIQNLARAAGLRLQCSHGNVTQVAPAAFWAIQPGQRARSIGSPIRTLPFVSA